MKPITKVENLIVKYKERLEAVKSLLKIPSIPISGFSLAQEQCFMKIIEELEFLENSKNEVELDRHYKILGLESENKNLKNALEIAYDLANSMQANFLIHNGEFLCQSNSWMADKVKELLDMKE